LAAGLAVSLHRPALLLLLLSLIGCDLERPPERILLIVVDTLRRESLELYGGPNPTPHLAALAERGQLFTHALASFHQTSASMASLFTGQTPSIESSESPRTLNWNGSTWCGLARFAREPRRAECVPASLDTLAERLRRFDYWTVGIASNDFLCEPSGYSAGFDDWVEVGRLPDVRALRINYRGGVERRTARIIPWSEVNRVALEALSRRPNDHFILYVHYMDVHDFGFRGVPYRKATQIVDGAIGQLLDSLDQQNLLDGTQIFVTADHGESLGEPHPIESGGGHIGNPSYMQLLAVPLLVAPAIPRDVDKLVRTQDLANWIVSLAGKEPTASNPSDTMDDDELFVGELNYLTLIRGRFKSSRHRRSGQFVLFDLEADPAETRDVSTDYPEVSALHRARADEIARTLRSSPRDVGSLTESDRERLEILGYLE